MSCRWSCATARRWWTTLERDPEVVAAYLDLARSGRRDEFRWLACSQGVPIEEIDTLWQGILARLDPRRA